MLILKTFGGLSVEADGAPVTGAARQRKTLALLALLAAAGHRGVSRDKLIAYLWPESDAGHAHHVLKQACYALRRDLHAPELFLGAVELRLNPDVIASDIGTLEDALARGDPARAVATYTGPFLDGFYLAGAADFERWVEETRAALKTRVGEALEALAARAAATGDVHEAVKWRRRLADLEPLSTRTAVELMQALVAAGDRLAAITFGRLHEDLVRQELGVAPDAAVSALLKRLRGEVNEDATVGRAIGDVSPSAALHLPGVATAPPPPRAMRIGKRLAIAGVVLLLVGGGVVVGSRRSASFDPELIAVAPFDVFDPNLELWHQGLVDVLSRNLDGAGAFRTVSPTVVIRRWRGHADRASAEGLGRRTGAGIVVFGQLLGAGLDSVRLSAAVLDARKGRTLAEFERGDQADRMDRLVDSLSLDVIRTLTPSAPGLHARLFSVGTRSLPALKAFLQGERFLRRFALDSAIASYDRAVAIDSLFALALRRLQLARGWNDSTGPEDNFARAAALNHGLSPRDSLLVLSDSGAAGPGSVPNHPAFRSIARRRVAVLEEAARRYPEDPEVWYQLGEARFHAGFVVGGSWNDARAAFDRAIALDSEFALAYVHPVEIALNDDDRAAALRYVRGYLAISSVIPHGAAMGLLNELLNPQGTRPREFARDLDTASPGALLLLALAVRSWPDSDETQLQVWPRLVATRRGRLNPGNAGLYPWLPVYLSMLPRVLIYRGHLREARALVGNRFGVPFMELAELGVIPRETVETALDQWFHHPSVEDLSLYPRGASGPCHRTLDAALWWAARRDTASLHRLLRREASAGRTSNPLAPANARPVPEFARAALALARGDSISALNRVLAFPDSLCPDAERLRAVRFRLLVAVGRDADAAAVFDRSHDRWVPSVLERARVAERLGDRPTAVHYYQFALQAWQHADPELQPVVAEARAALTRLGEERRR